MMKFMKRALSLLISAMLLLGCFALAEEAPLLPIAIVSYDLTDEATTAALSALIEPKENALTRWERVVLSDGREAWVICQFDQTTMSNAWSRVIDAETQEVLQGGHDRHRFLRHRAGPLGECKGHLCAVEHSGQDAV